MADIHILDGGQEERAGHRLLLLSAGQRNPKAILVAIGAFLVSLSVHICSNSPSQEHAVQALISSKVFGMLLFGTFVFVLLLIESTVRSAMVGNLSSLEVGKIVTAFSNHMLFRLMTLTILTSQKQDESFLRSELALWGIWFSVCGVLRAWVTLGRVRLKDMQAQEHRPPSKGQFIGVCSLLLTVVLVSTGLCFATTSVVNSGSLVLLLVADPVTEVVASLGLLSIEGFAVVAIMTGRPSPRRSLPFLIARCCREISVSFIQGLHMLQLVAMKGFSIQTWHLTEFALAANSRMDIARAFYSAKKVFNAYRARRASSSSFRAATAEECTEDVCAICMHEQCQGDSIVLPCSHVFHKECIQSWLTTSFKCPKCRQNPASKAADRSAHTGQQLGAQSAQIADSGSSPDDLVTNFDTDVASHQTDSGMGDGESSEEGHAQPHGSTIQQASMPLDNSLASHSAEPELGAGDEESVQAMQQQGRVGPVAHVSQPISLGSCSPNENVRVHLGPATEVSREQLSPNHRPVSRRLLADDTEGESCVRGSRKSARVVSFAHCIGEHNDHQTNQSAEGGNGDCRGAVQDCNNNDCSAASTLASTATTFRDASTVVCGVEHQDVSVPEPTMCNPSQGSPTSMIEQCSTCGLHQNADTGISEQSLAIDTVGIAPDFPEDVVEDAIIDKMDGF